MYLYQQYLEAHAALARAVFTIRFADPNKSTFIITALAGDATLSTSNIVDVTLVDAETLTPIDLLSASDDAIITFARTRSALDLWKSGECDFPLVSDDDADTIYHATLTLLTQEDSDGY